jgi:hypothetical protein
MKSFVYFVKVSIKKTLKILNFRPLFKFQAVNHIYIYILNGREFIATLN